MRGFLCLTRSFLLYFIVELNVYSTLKIEAIGDLSKPLVVFWSLNLIESFDGLFKVKISAQLLLMQGHWHYFCGKIKTIT